MANLETTLARAIALQAERINDLEAQRLQLGRDLDAARTEYRRLAEAHVAAGERAASQLATAAAKIEQLEDEVLQLLEALGVEDDPTVERGLAAIVALRRQAGACAETGTAPAPAREARHA